MHTLEFKIRDHKELKDHLIALINSYLSNHNSKNLTEYINDLSTQKEKPYNRYDESPA